MPIRRMQAYISGPLQAARDLERARAFYEFVAQVCREAGVEAYLPHMHTDPIKQMAVSDEEVFARDYGAMRDADLIVAAIGVPSSGVGAELGVAFQAGTPVVAMYRADERPSRFLLGMLKQMPNSVVFRFADETDCETHLLEILGRLQASTAAGELSRESAAAPRRAVAGSRPTRSVTSKDDCGNME